MSSALTCVGGGLILLTMNYEVEVVDVISDRDVDDLLVAAFEGGITYWCTDACPVKQGEDDEWWPPEAVMASDTLTRGGDVMLFDAEDDEWRRLTLENFISAISRYCTKRKMSVDRLMEDHDALMVDELVQMAVFGELVYG